MLPITSTQNRISHILISNITGNRHGSLCHQNSVGQQPTMLPKRNRATIPNKLGNAPTTWKRCNTKEARVILPAKFRAACISSGIGAFSAPISKIALRICVRRCRIMVASISGSIPTWTMALLMIINDLTDYYEVVNLATGMTFALDNMN
ncbi:hypothetical protein VNO78_15555 [Psophocarpus tetragonolobus]|uniref:Uncharacterized protein n=1 Tax=Psophocarpus tetragonolobus TaxID=3891 RepID=A0AAN9SGA3_PSOTE